MNRRQSTSPSASSRCVLSTACRIVLAFIALFVAPPASAYLGPALGLGVVGTVVAIIVVALLSLLSFVVLPLRRLWGRHRRRRGDAATRRPRR